jgi:hypothetical protein
MNYLNRLIIFFILYPAIIIAQDSDFKAVSDASLVLGKLNNRAKEITSFQCDFLQQKYMSYLDATIESNGKFTFKKKIRFDGNI